MENDTSRGQSRRAILAAAAAGAAGLAASTLAVPALVAAAPGTNMQLDQDNPTDTAVTSITQTLTDTGAFKGIGNGAGAGVEGQSATGDGVLGTVSGTHHAGVSGLGGDASASSHEDPSTDLDSGVYGWSDATDISSGVWGESGSGYGVFGESDGGTGVGASGFIAVHGAGLIGLWSEGTIAAAVFGDVGGTGLQAHVGGIGTAPSPKANTAVLATVDSLAHVGLEAHGRVILADRAGKKAIAKGRSSVAITVPGMTSGNIAVATLNANRSGRWVQSVVCATNKITIYLNGKLSATTNVSWVVLG